MLKAMLEQIRQKPSARRKAAELYAALAEQARNPVFYRDMRVPDTLDGRFDLIVLLLALTEERLGREEGNGEFIRLLQEAFFADMDRNLREMGVGDMGVGRRVRKMAEAYFGRAKAYREAEEGEALAAVLIRNVYAGLDCSSEIREAAAKLSARVGEWRRMLSKAEIAQLQEGQWIATDKAHSSEAVA